MCLYLNLFCLNFLLFSFKIDERFLFYQTAPKNDKCQKIRRSWTHVQTTYRLGIYKVTTSICNFFSLLKRKITKTKIHKLSQHSNAFKILFTHKTNQHQSVYKIYVNSIQIVKQILSVVVFTAFIMFYGSNLILLNYFVELQSRTVYGENLSNVCVLTQKKIQKILRMFTSFKWNEF